MKKKQLKIILESNPCYDDYHTWIRELSDIKTFEETFQDEDYIGYDNFMRITIGRMQKKPSGHAKSPSTVPIR